MADLILGPLLRYVGTTDATVWVEADAACEIEVLGHRERTFFVEGHHYALVLIDDLEPGAEREYEVGIDGRRVWPPDDGRPPSRIVTRRGESESRLVFGSCRAGAPHRPPYTLSPEDHPEGLGIDALWTLSRRLQTGDEPWPDCLLLLGDQMYADEVSPAVADHLRRRDERAAAGDAGDARPPEGEVGDFEDYTRLYRESWSDPDIRWLLATVPSTMVFDDHDVRDDWNISQAWVSDMRELPWWDARICGAFMAYWVYQHIGNLAPPELGEERMLAEVRAADGDVGPRLRVFARNADRDTTSSRFAFHRDFGRSRLVVIDTRAARVLTPGARDIVDAAEWEWIARRTEGDFDHLLLASTVPVFAAPGVHNIEAWNERVCDGAWGGRAARLGERVRRAIDIDHWPAFGRSFARMVELLRRRASSTDPRSPAPVTILLLGGDVHTAYVARVWLGDGQRSRVHQLVCSPFRKPLATRERRIVLTLFTRAAALVTRAMARGAGAPAPDATWQMVAGPTFHNSVAALDLDRRAAHLTIRRSIPGEDGASALEVIQELELAEDNGRPGGAVA